MSNTCAHILITGEIHMDIIKSFNNKYYFLSNFYEAPVEYNGVTYCNSEAAFQHAKCANLTSSEQIKFVAGLGTRLKNLVMVYADSKDENVLTTVFSKANPSVSKRLGRVVPIRSDWEDVKYTIMEEIVRNKFSQNEKLKQALLNTGDAALVEGNHWHDNTWGICTCDKCYGKVGSNGENNNFGAILMKVREDLRNKS